MTEDASRQLLKENSVHRVRIATLIAAAVLGSYVVFILAVHYFGLLVFPQIAAVLVMLVSAVVVNLALATGVRVWARRRMSVYVYEGFHAAWFTVLLVFTGGGIDLGVAFVIYGFFVVHSWIMRPDASAYVTANLCALCFTALGVAEAYEWVGTVPLLHRPPRVSERAVYILFGFLSLNSLALYASRYAAERRRLAEKLAALVVERTAALARTNGELEANARALETKQRELGEFVYLVTHDLKAPVNNALLFADALLESPRHTLSQEVRGRLKRIRYLSGRAEDMITDLWKFVRTTAVEENPTWIDLGALVADALESLEATIEAKKIRVAVGPLPMAWGQQNLEHVVANLVGNAVKYTPSGQEIEVSGRTEDGAVLFCVRDYGIGIAADFHQRIFDLYVQVPSQGNGDGARLQGTGVGLAIVKRIVESHGGNVWVDSAPAEGSQFWVRLPLPPGAVVGHPT